MQPHALTAGVLFAAWPLTRLVHVWVAPVGHPARPYTSSTTAGPRRPARRSREEPVPGGLPDEDRSAHAISSSMTEPGRRRCPPRGGRRTGPAQEEAQP
ncbi:respiratory nitrate reductase subunit gamma [Streptomyces griseorubiginosus]|uniref:respiratory nitrate reductase subunit gamma n=1 Tax=Streptomyces griseorubiginosus TaxID=67304 RepID=UPI003F775ABA